MSSAPEPDSRCEQRIPQQQRCLSRPRRPRHRLPCCEVGGQSGAWVKRATKGNACKDVHLGPLPPATHLLAGRRCRNLVLIRSGRSLACVTSNPRKAGPIPLLGRPSWPRRQGSAGKMLWEPTDTHRSTHGGPQEGGVCAGTQKLGKVWRGLVIKTGPRYDVPPWFASSFHAPSDHGVWNAGTRLSLASAWAIGCLPSLLGAACRQ